MENVIEELQRELADLSGVVSALAQDIKELRVENEVITGMVNKLDQEKNASKN